MIMEIKPKSNKVYSLLVLYDMHTLFFERAIEGISDEDAHKRLDTKANHIAWIAGSLVQQRFELAKMHGVDEKQSADELFKDNKGIQDNVKYPSLASYQKDWNKISPVLREALLNATDEKLEEKFEMMPGMEFQIFEMLTFCIYREANCIGQIALWRRLLGYDALRYDM
jgi:hypothetical protein